MEPLTRLLIQVGYELAKRIPDNVGNSSGSNVPSNKQPIPVEVVFVTCPNCSRVNRKASKVLPENYKCSYCDKYFNKTKEQERLFKEDEIAKIKAKEQKSAEMEKIFSYVFLSICICLGIYLGLKWTGH